MDTPKRTSTQTRPGLKEAFNAKGIHEPIHPVRKAGAAGVVVFSSIAVGIVSALVVMTLCFLAFTLLI